MNHLSSLLFLAFASLWLEVNGVLCFGSSKLLSLMCVLDHSQEMLQAYIEGLGSEKETELGGVRQSATAQLKIQASMLRYSSKTGNLPTQ